MAYKYVGKSYIRPDAISKVTGKAVYLDDIRMPGMLYTAILRPPDRTCQDSQYRYPRGGANAGRGQGGHR